MTAASKVPHFASRAIATVTLERGETLFVMEGESTTLDFDQGGAWIGQEGSCMRFFVAAGERFTLYRRGVARVVAQDDSRLTVRVTRSCAGPTRLAIGNRIVYERRSWTAMVARLFCDVAVPSTSPSGGGRRAVPWRIESARD